MKDTMNKNPEFKAEIDSVVQEIRELAATVGWEYQFDDKRFRDFHFSPTSLQSDFEEKHQISA